MAGEAVDTKYNEVPVSPTGRGNSGWPEDVAVDEFPRSGGTHLQSALVRDRPLAHFPVQACFTCICGLPFEVFGGSPLKQSCGRKLPKSFRSSMEESLMPPINYLVFLGPLSEGT